MENVIFDLLAGNTFGFGCADGVGCRAQFDDLRKTFVNTKHLYARCNGEPQWLWRLVRLDLSTLKADTIHVSGLDHDADIVRCFTRLPVRSSIICWCESAEQAKSQSAVQAVLEIKKGI